MSLSIKVGVSKSVCGIFHIRYWFVFIKDTNKEKAPTGKTQVSTKSINMDIWVIGTLNQLFIRGSYTEIKFSKKCSS